MKLPYIEAGEIVTTHGVRGEVKVLSWLDSPEMLCEFDRCRISGREYVMDSVRVQKTCNLVKLRGVDTMEDAQKLRGKTMELYREDISDELIFASELVDDGAPAAAVRVVVHLILLVCGVVPYLVGFDGNVSPLLRAPQNAFGKHIPQRVGKQRQNVNPHRLPFPSAVSPASDFFPDRWKE